MSDRDRDPNEFEDDPDEIENEESPDAGSLDDEGGDEAETGQEPSDEEAQERVDGGRRARRIQALRREAQENRERASRLERELSEERQRRQQPAQPQGPQEESEDAFRARCALMEPEARIMATLERSETRHRREMFISQLRTADAVDKAQYDARAAYDPRYKKYAPQVEALIQQERQQGRYPSREQVISFVIGQAVLNNPTKDKQRDKGRENIRRETTRADSGRGDVPTQRRQKLGTGDTLADREYRLRDVNI